MNSRDRQQMRHALGLVEWQPRPDGPLVVAGSMRAGAPAEPAEDEPRLVASPAEPQPVSPLAPASESPAPELAEAPAPAAAGDATPSPPADAVPWPDDGDADLAATFQSEDAPEAEAGPPKGRVSPTRDMSWEQLEAWLGEQDHRGAQRPVFGVGARDADVLIVGEAPGASEDAQGVPFVGRAGKLLDRMLFAIDCSRQTNVYITNICKFRPPDNRDPNADEVAADWPVLERQIELMNPKLVVAVGRVAAQTLLDSKEALGKMRGRLHQYPKRELDVLVTYHPAFLLRSPQQKTKAWEDLMRIADHIGKATHTA
ncbi:uracil-DNA glycosylase [Salinisphaera aquimarina]|uniref:Type-4 uracil-DNA glycosylase n=1 Tax=Salinisphaera aquimarina TaxID=2094031 RepID=A0ABV7EQQ7_9GAMM